MTDQEMHAFANFKWPSRWNDAEQIAFVTSVGSEIFFTNCMGVVRCQSEDAQYIAHQLRKAADALERFVQEGRSVVVLKRPVLNVRPDASATDPSVDMYGHREDH